jgi:hypothetical protein
MDPNATWSVVTDETEDSEVRDIAAADLVVWLARGGFVPAGVTYGYAMEVCRQRIHAAAGL